MNQKMIAKENRGETAYRGRRGKKDKTAHWNTIIEVKANKQHLIVLMRNICFQNLKQECEREEANMIKIREGLYQGMLPTIMKYYEINLMESKTPIDNIFKKKSA